MEEEDAIKQKVLSKILKEMDDKKESSISDEKIKELELLECYNSGFEDIWPEKTISKEFDEIIEIMQILKSQTADPKDLTLLLSKNLFKLKGQKIDLERAQQEREQMCEILRKLSEKEKILEDEVRKLEEEQNLTAENNESKKKYQEDFLLNKIQAEKKKM